MPRLKYCIRRGRNWSVVVGVPERARQYEGGRRQIVRSLRTSDVRTARVRRDHILNAYRDRWLEMLGAKWHCSGRVHEAVEGRLDSVAPWRCCPDPQPPITVRTRRRAKVAPPMAEATE